MRAVPTTQLCSLTAVWRIRFAKGGGDLGPSAGFPRLHGIKSNASRGAPASALSLPCFCESASGGNQIRHTVASGFAQSYARYIAATEINVFWYPDIAPGWQARWRPCRAFRLPHRDSKRSGKFTVDAGARREALDMYPRERWKPTDAAKSPARFERNAWRICPANKNPSESRCPLSIHTSYRLPPINSRNSESAGTHASSATAVKGDRKSQTRLARI